MILGLMGLTSETEDPFLACPVKQEENIFSPVFKNGHDDCSLIPVLFKFYLCAKVLTSRMEAPDEQSSSNLPKKYMHFVISLGFKGMGLKLKKKVFFKKVKCPTNSPLA